MDHQNGGKRPPFLQVLKAIGSQYCLRPASLLRVRGRVKLENGDAGVQILINPSPLNRCTLVLFALTSVGLSMCICVRSNYLSFQLHTQKGTEKNMKKKKVRLGSTLQAFQPFFLSNRRPCLQMIAVHGGFDMDRPCL
jgi:hypothetical protein